MAGPQKLKINALAKSFDIKSKDLLNVYEELNIAGKSHMTTLENEDVNILFEYLTKNNQVEDIEKYFTSIDKPKPAAPEKPKTAEPKKSDTVSKAAGADKTKTDSPAKTDDIKPVEKNPAIQASPKPDSDGDNENINQKPVSGGQRGMTASSEIVNKPQSAEQTSELLPNPIQPQQTILQTPMTAQTTPAVQTNQPAAQQSQPPQPFRPQSTTTQQPFRPQGTTTQQPFRPQGTTTQQPFRPQGTTTQQPFRPQGTTTQQPFRPQGTTTQQPFRPQGTTTQQPFRPQGTTTQQPFRPQGTATQQPFRPQGTTTQQPFRPQSTTTQQPFRPQGTTTQQPFRPQGTTTQQPFRPQGTATQQPFRPQGTATQQPFRPQQNQYSGQQQRSQQQPWQPQHSPKPQAPVSTNTFTSAKQQQTVSQIERFQQKRDIAAPQSNLQKPRLNENRTIRQNINQPNFTGGKNVSTTIDIITGENIKFQAGVKDDAARIVDTRTTTVDLSRYDERLDKFVPQTLNYTTEKQKIQKKNTNVITFNRAGKPIDKERLALEKIQKKQFEQEKAKKKQLSIILPDEMIVSDLASKLHVTSSEVVKKLFMLGVKASVNQTIDYETAALAAMEFGAKVTKEVVLTIEDKLFEQLEDTESMLISRAPVVVVMGHVDHGKTSLLDAIKDSNVTAGEAGGITQHIGAYRVRAKDSDITFLDTPGHEAFTAMRARGAQVTDIAIIVVAADDGIMPQTIEAINHAKAAGVSIIVAINKIDKPQANIEQVKQELTKYELVPEEWGGDTICVPVSALTKKGIDELLDMILLTAEMKELKANPNRFAKGIVIEAKLDKGKGPIATVLIQNGTLNNGDIVIAGTTVGRVRTMSDDKGNIIKSAGPSVPVEIVGLSETPSAGDMFRAVDDERMARELVEQRKSEEKEDKFNESSNITLDDLFAQVKAGVKELNIIIKADVGGSAEALKASLIKESTAEVKVCVIHSGVGGVTESDVMLANASKAIVVGFNVRPDKTALDTADLHKVDIRTYRIIYECIEEIRAALKGMLAPKFKEVVLGHAQVRQTIHVPNVGTIAGSYIQDGKITRASQIRVVRDGIMIFEDKISSLKRFKDDVKEVAQGYECGIGLDRFNDIKVLDILESFVMEQIKE